ncbi:RNA polymerase sigma factor [Enhygromyxa salina]|uniref:ECF RNA polymerase sigma-E factor n=1 Tax=Enhygromyxa salina TaxID=215803 RepID=A0A2S9YNG9_9BACT|nr:RNA polymerase sigma factor [Enhygromyxa salina]PRQ06640.1 ECF RNA polymerase sigma-E factor [Enhygromyxa salina]
MDMADRDLLVAWRAGDRGAGGQIIDRHYKSLHRFFCNKVGSADEVEELVQRCFMGAVEGLVRFRADASVRTWLFAIARNILRQWIDEQVRKRSREAPAVSSVADLGAGASTLVGKRREQRLLLEALRHIPIESQLILELSYWERLTAKQIGEVLDCPEGTARSRVRKAKQELRGTLDGLARTAGELESTVNGLDDWAKQIRVAWGV